MKSSILCLLPTLASSFIVRNQISSTFRPSTFVISSSESSDNQEENSEGLVFENLDKEMSKMSSKYSFTESDYLAAARKRAEMKMESSNSGASDEEWQGMANEKKEQLGDIDDWENSVKEAGNADSQILMFTDPPADSDDGDGEDDEPKLLLF